MRVSSREPPPCRVIACPSAERCPDHLRRAVRRRAVGNPPARRPRRRDHQDRGSGDRGDVGRYVPPFQEGEDSLFFETFNRGKKSISLDLRHPGARDVLHDLVRVCDAVYSNLRGDQPRKLGLTYDQLRDVNPAIVCCSLSGFGMSGPTRLGGRLRLHDAGARGLAEPHGRARRAPDEERALARRPLGRIRIRDRDARGHLAGPPRRGRLRLRRVAVRDGAPRADVHRPVGGDARVRAAAAREQSLTRRSCRSRTSRRRTAGSWSAAAKQSFWERTCAVIGRPDLSEDERFATMAGRNANRDELVPVLEEAFRSRHRAGVDRRARRGRCAGVTGEHGRGGTRRPADGRPRGHRRVRASVARDGTLDSDSASTRVRRGEPGARTGAQPTPRRAHRRPCSRASAGTRPSACSELAAAGVFGTAE